MKRIIQLTSALLLIYSFGLSTVYAQAPEKMSYQAVIRDASNNLTTNQAVGMQISILQGSATGSAVYVETQTPTTNANGLVTLEIGTGTVVSGDFTTIDWANGTYFIKTETDPTTAGGTNYTITGTSQLMSVPYALHAKSAESIIGTVNYTETDPIFWASIANGITAADTANWNNHTIDTDTQLDSTGIASLGFVVGAHTVDTDTHIDSTGIAGLGYVAGAHTDSTAIANMGFVAGSGSGHYIGESFGGGIVFFVYDNGKHGLIAATADQSTGIQWYNGSATVTNAVRDGIGAGSFNTERIIVNQSTGSYAAQICANYQGGNYGDWYLPSLYELNLLYLQNTVVGGFSAVSYWSSSEFNNGSAKSFLFLYGYSSTTSKTASVGVRAIRAF